LIENQDANDSSRPTPLNSATWTNVSISATDAADIARKPVRLDYRPLAWIRSLQGIFS
jgi:hypothetical protein